MQTSMSTALHSNVMLKIEGGKDWHLTLTLDSRKEAFNEDNNLDQRQQQHSIHPKVAYLVGNELSNDNMQVQLAS